MLVCLQNEEYPGLCQTGTLCSHILRVVEGVCFVRLDLHSFSLDCSSDWLSVIGADGGQSAVPSLCGDRRGQASKCLSASPQVLTAFSSLLVMIPVQERQNLILAVGVQSRARAHWIIQATMIHCGHVSLDWRGENTRHVLYGV